MLSVNEVDKVVRPNELDDLEIATVVGLSSVDFDTLAQRRGDHLVMMNHDDQWSDVCGEDRRSDLRLRRLPVGTLLKIS